MLALTGLRGLTAIGLVAAGLGVAILSGGFTPSTSSAVALAPSGPVTAVSPPATIATSPSAPDAAAPPSPAPRIGSPAGRQVGSSGPALPPRTRQSRPAAVSPGAASPLAIYFGLSDFQLQTALSQGQTLAEIAQAQGISTTDLKSFLLSQVKAQYDQAVVTGQITSQQEETMLAGASGQLDQFMTANLASQVTTQGDGGSGSAGGDDR
jgi:hypothetical protein